MDALRVLNGGGGSCCDGSEASESEPSAFTPSWASSCACDACMAGSSSEGAVSLMAPVDTSAAHGLSRDAIDAGCTMRVVHSKPHGHALALAPAPSEQLPASSATACEFKGGEGSPPAGVMCSTAGHAIPELLPDPVLPAYSGAATAAFVGAALSSRLSDDRASCGEGAHIKYCM